MIRTGSGCKRWLAGFALLLLQPAVHAQTLFLDNAQLSLNATQGQASVVIDPASGNVTVRSATGNITQCSGGGGGSPVVNLSVAPTNPLAGSSVTLTWTSSNIQGGSSFPCTPSGGAGTSWAGLGPQPANNTSGVSVNIPSGTAPGTQISFTLTCTGTNGSGQDTKTVTVQDPSQPNCPGAIPGLTRAGPGSWQQVFGASFPEPRGANRQLDIARGTYVALEFNSRTATQINPPVTSTVDLNTTEFMTSGAALLSVSRCEGEFGAQYGNQGSTLPARCRGGPSGVASMRVQYENIGTDNCTLLPNTTYFFNITYGSQDAPGGGMPYCTGATNVCSMRVSAQW